MSKKKNQNVPQKRTCVLCGKYIPFYRADCIVGATGRVVCSDCLQTSQKRALLRLPDTQPHGTPSASPVASITPQEIIAGMDKTIIGQQAAKEAVALALWKQKLLADGNKAVPRCNLLLCGPTGCGKTALIEAAAKLVDLPVRIVDSTTVTQCGWKGKDPEEAIYEYMAANKGHDNLEFGVVVWDEFDKLYAPPDSEQHAAANRGAQHGLLKLVEGAKITHDSVTINTANIMFVFAGAFSAMRKGLERETTCTTRPIGFAPSASMEAPAPYKGSFEISDFVAYGMEPELMGRVGQIIELQALSEQDLTRIILESDTSIFGRYKSFFAGFGIELTLSDAAAKDIARYALQRGTGARGLNARIEQLVAPLMFRLSAGKLSGTVDLLEGEMHSAAC